MELPEHREVATRFTHSDGPYWIYVGRIQHPEMNHVRLIEAYETLYATNPQLPHLVCAGGDWFGCEDVHARHAISPAKERIHFCGFVSDEEVSDLLGNANACIYPSLLESFGPIIEAMSLGIPVACSEMSSLPIRAQHAAIRFDPLNSGQMADALRTLAYDSHRRLDLVESGLRESSDFMWRICAEQTLEELCRTSQ